MIETKEKAVLNPAVVASRGQSIPCNELSIADYERNCNSNCSIKHHEEIIRQVEGTTAPLLVTLSELVKAERPVWSGTAMELATVLNCTT